MDYINSTSYILTQNLYSVMVEIIQNEMQSNEIIIVSNLVLMELLTWNIINKQIISEQWSMIHSIWSLSISSNIVHTLKYLARSLCQNTVMQKIYLFIFTYLFRKYKNMIKTEPLTCEMYSYIWFSFDVLFLKKFEFNLPWVHLCVHMCLLGHPYMQHN
jgi:hypothetical protein